jgi:hypothetical protein
MAIEFVHPEQLPRKLKEHLVHYRYNPSMCVCGWYCFTFANCTHVHRKLEKKCGKATSKTGKPVFCKTPAPTHVISTVKLWPLYPCDDYNCQSWRQGSAAQDQLPNLFASGHLQASE